jgi:hypothetical protein
MEMCKKDKSNDGTRKGSDLPVLATRAVMILKSV